MSLHAENITKLYGKQKALDSVSFKIETGEVVGFLGPNGAGKSTMMKIITGYINQSSGNVFINGKNISENPVEIKKMIGYLPEHNPLYLDMYVKEYLNFVAGIYKLSDIKNAVNNIIEKTGLQPEKSKRIKALSKGFRQRVGLAAALIHDPEVLILDEPTTGLDPNQIIEIRNLIKEVGKNKTIMLSTHIMQEVEAICDKVIIIDKGKIVANDTAGNIQTLTKENHQTVNVEFDKEIDKETLLKINEVAEVKQINSLNWLIYSSSDKDIRQEIFNFAVKSKLTVLSMQKKEKTIEDVFIELTK